MTLRCIVWAAVSTPDQAKDEKESIPAQIEQARKTIQERGWYEVAEPLVVPGHSRYINWLDQAVAEIPQMKELVELAEANKVDLVVVRDWDRLARTDSLRVQISTRLREQGVQVYSLNQPVEPSDHPGKVTDTALIVEGMAGILAEIENRLRARRWATGMLGRIKRGSWPWTVPPYGYTREPGSQTPPHRGPTQPVGQQAYALRLLVLLKHHADSAQPDLPGTDPLPWPDLCRQPCAHH